MASKACVLELVMLLRDSCIIRLQNVRRNLDPKQEVLHWEHASFLYNPLSTVWHQQGISVMPTTSWKNILPYHDQDQNQKQQNQVTLHTELMKV